MIGSCSASSCELVGAAVLLLVVRERVRVRARHHRVDEARSCARAHVRDRVGALALAHLEVVAAVHLHDVQPADAAHHLRDRRGRLVGRAHRDRVAVVGDDVEHREVQTARGVERLPELAFGSRAFAERHVGELVAVRGAAGELGPPADVARRFRAPDRGEALAAGARRLGDDVERLARPSDTASAGRPRRDRRPTPTACSSISSGVTPSASASARSR